MAKVVVILSEMKADLHNNSLYCVPGLAGLYWTRQWRAA